jgi:cation:H+ antiporter
MKTELPILTVVSLIAALQLFDGEISRMDAAILILLFAMYMIFTVKNALRSKHSKMAKDVEKDLEHTKMPLGRAVFWLISGLSMLIVSSRMLVWGAVEIAHGLGISDLIIGLTIVAVGTSLPEFASSVVAARKGEHDIALGNIIGSNLFNTLVVVGIAGLIGPMQAQPEILYRDVAVMIIFTISLFLFGYRFSKKSGRINRYEGATMLAMYLGYTLYLALGAF